MQVTEMNMVLRKSCLALVVTLTMIPAAIVDAQQEVFSGDFEAATLEEISARWDDVKYPEHMSLSDDVPAGSPGRQSLMITVHDVFGRRIAVLRDGQEDRGRERAQWNPGSAAPESYFIRFVGAERTEVRRVLYLGGS
jgi:hypothetical protein